MTEITQADRLLLADLFDLPQSKAMELFAGKHDENEAIGTKLEALARHREQAAAEERIKGEAQAAEIEKLRGVLREVFEEWAGSEGFIPETAPEGYLLHLTKRMADIARAALGETK